MDASLIVAGTMALLKPLLEKAGEKAAETIGEKVAEKTTEKSFWQTVKRAFILDDEEAMIQEIENKPIATQADMEMIEKKVSAHITTDPQFAAEAEAAFNLSSTKMFQAELLLKSLQKDRETLKELYDERRDASIDAVGGYEVKIAQVIRRMEKDEKKFRNLTTK